MLNIDGSFGEGGGQVLRSALALSLCTGQPFRIERIRGGRSKPGLMRQHLTAVQAAARVGNAAVDGATIGSQVLSFTPGRIQPGEYHFAVGTAGSTTLVLQTILPALLTAAEPSQVTLEGGTHNPFAPPFDFLVQAYLPLVNRMGPRVEAALERPGFYPAGGGRFTVRVEPVARLAGFALLERGEIRQRRACAVVANLPRHIAERELHVIARRLNWPADTLEVRETQQSPGPGNILTLEVRSEHVTEVFTGFGERDRAAEAVAEHAVQQCQRYLAARVPVGQHLADQLLLPLALAGSGSFRTLSLSRHSTTHIELIARFLSTPVRAEATPECGTVVTLGTPPAADTGGRRDPQRLD